MRELKFRAWDTVMKRYVPENEVLLVDPYDFKSYGNRYIWEQYTGLKDKNGKEIYEGDIVDDGYSRICEIRWSEHFTAFEAINKKEGYTSNVWFISEYGEVIGNIHENPELLDKEEESGRSKE